MYDYVIVGAGSAGCVLAARLSEDPDIKVCLIEAGPDDDSPNVRIPAFGGRLLRTELDWDYDSHPEPGCNQRRLYLPRGRVLGGTSSMNGMIYIRGSRADYDEWQLPGWSFAELLPYFKRSEDNERGASPYHGIGGPLGVSDCRSRAPGSEAFVAAAIEAGYPANHDFNGPTQDGFEFFQITQRDGRRCSTSVGFLHPARQRPNLTVETSFSAHRITFAGNRATGVVGRRFGQEVTIAAAREVIVAGGAYNSPQLLMHSGVGPADLLRSLDIEVVVDQPQVGQNLQDHPHAWLVFGHSETEGSAAESPAEQLRRFEQEGMGPLTANGPEAGGFVRTSPGLPEPDIQFNFLPFMFLDSGLTMPTGPGISYGPCVLKPLSRGSVTVVSSDPTAKPKILHNYYAEDADLDTAVAGLRVALEISRQRALRPYTERPIALPASDAEADLRSYLRQQTHTLYHPVGTCAMGTVVDAELRVIGVDGLRVADASVMPTVPRGNTNAPTIVVAERAADLIRNVLPLTPELPAADGGIRSH